MPTPAHVIHMPFHRMGIDEGKKERDRDKDRKQKTPLAPGPNQTLCERGMSIKQ